MYIETPFRDEGSFDPKHLNEQDQKNAKTLTPYEGKVTESFYQAYNPDNLKAHLLR